MYSHKTLACSLIHVFIRVAEEVGFKLKKYPGDWKMIFWTKSFSFNFFSQKHKQLYVATTIHLKAKFRLLLTLPNLLTNICKTKQNFPTQLSLH
jgi:hypothetical protein